MDFGAALNVTEVEEEQTGAAAEVLDNDEEVRVLSRVGPDEFEKQEIVKRALDVEAAKVALRPYLVAIDGMVQEASSIVIEDDAENAAAVALGTTAKMLAKKIEEQRKRIVEKPNDFVKGVNSFCRIFTDKLGNIEDVLKVKLSQYRVALEQKRREQEKAAKKEAAEMQKKMEAEAKEKNIAPPEAIAPVLPKKAATVRTETGSASGRKQWVFKVVNEAEIPREWLRLDEMKVRDAIRGGVRNIEGLEIYQEETTTFRTH